MFASSTCRALATVDIFVSLKCFSLHQRMVASPASMTKTSTQQVQQPTRYLETQLYAQNLQPRDQAV